MQNQGLLMANETHPKRVWELAENLERWGIHNAIITQETAPHLADQLVLFAALAAGETRYRIPGMTDHIESNLWLVETMLGARTMREGNVIAIEGIGLVPKTQKL